MSGKSFSAKKFFIFFLIVYTLFKLFYLTILKVPLSFDESYYWDWSRHPAFGYYSKPPMIAWIIFFSTKLFGNTEFGVRFPALLCNILTLFIFYLFTKKFFFKYPSEETEQRAFWLVLTLAFVPILTVYSFVMTIDPPLFLFWILALYFFLNYLQTPSPVSAILTGIFCGLGLLTKQTMLAFLFFAFLYLLLFRKNLLLSFKTLLIPLIAFLVYFPNVYWNFKHGFIMLKHTEHHFSRKSFSFLTFLKFFLGCAGVFSPVFFFHYLKTGVSSLYYYVKKYSIFFLFSFPWIIFFLFFSFFVKLNLNWIFPFVLAGYFAWTYFCYDKRLFNLLKLNFFLSFFFSLIILGLPIFPNVYPVFCRTILKKFYPWKILGKEVEKIYLKERKKEKLPLLADSRKIASAIAFYTNFHPEVYVIKHSKVPENQYHIWREDTALIGKEVFLVKDGASAPCYLKKAEKRSIIKVKFARIKWVYSVWKGVYVKECK